MKILCNAVVKIQTETIPNLELQLDNKINNIKVNNLNDEVKIDIEN